MRMPNAKGVRLLASLSLVLMTLALMAIGGIALWQHLPEVTAMETSPKTWSQAGRTAPAFAVSQFIFPGKTETYEIFRHPEGGRKDVFRWSGSGGTPTPAARLARFVWRSRRTPPEWATRRIAIAISWGSKPTRSI